MAKKDKIVTPTAAEQVIIDRRLRKKYPHMYEKDWLKRLKKNVKKEFRTRKTSQIAEGLKGAGISVKKEMPTDLQREARKKRGRK